MNKIKDINGISGKNRFLLKNPIDNDDFSRNPIDNHRFIEII